MTYNKEIVLSEIGVELEKIFERIFHFEEIFKKPIPKITLTLQKKFEIEDVPDEPHFTRIPGEFSGERNEILIHLKSIDPNYFKDEFIKTFIHESIHAIQWNIGPENIGDVAIECDKDKIELNSDLSYRLRPHEREAFYQTRPLRKYIEEKYPIEYKRLSEIATILDILINGFHIEYRPINLVRFILEEILPGTNPEIVLTINEQEIIIEIAGKAKITTRILKTSLESIDEIMNILRKLQTVKALSKAGLAIKCSEKSCQARGKNTIRINLNCKDNYTEEDRGIINICLPDDYNIHYYRKNLDEEILKMNLRNIIEFNANKKILTLIERSCGIFGGEKLELIIDKEVLSKSPTAKRILEHIEAIPKEEDISLEELEKMLDELKRKWD